MVARPAGAASTFRPASSWMNIAAGLDRPRTLRVAPNGDVFLAESGADANPRIARHQRWRAAAIDMFAAGLSQPFGIAFWPPGPDPRFVYIALMNRVVRVPYQSGDLRARGPPEVVVPHLPTGGHWTRDLVFSPMAAMFVSVGSASNAGTYAGATDLPVQAMRRRGTRRIVPTCWHSIPMAATRRIFATGLRNCTAEAIHPATGALWCVVNERDGLGDNLPPDYATSRSAGPSMAGPGTTSATIPDPRLKGQRPPGLRAMSPCPMC